MEVSQYIQTRKPTPEINSRIEDNKKISSELLKAANPEANEIKNSFAPAEYHWPGMSRRSRHSYSYYNLNSN